MSKGLLLQFLLSGIQTLLLYDHVLTFDREVNLVPQRGLLPTL